MISLMRSFLSSVLFCSLLLCSPGVLSDEQDDLDAVLKELETLNSQLQEYHREQDDLESQMRDQEVELSRLHREIYSTDRSIDLGEERLRILAEEQSELQVLLGQQEQALRSDLVAMYKNGEEEPVKILLNLEDPAQLNRILVYYRYLLAARSEHIDAFNNTIDEIELNQASIDEQNSKLAELRGTLQQQEASLNASQARRARLLERLANRILSAEQQIAERQKNARRLEQLIQETIEAIARLAPPESYKPFAELKGEYQWPTTGPIIHRYGASRSGGLDWQGVVLRSSGGTEVHNVHHGRVVFADYMRGYGLLVIVDHEDGYMTLYGHNQSLFVEPGDWVTPGEALALVGNTGGIPESGLYFEIRQNGRPVNPALWCSS